MECVFDVLQSKTLFLSGKAGKKEKRFFMLTTRSSVKPNLKELAKLVKVVVWSNACVNHTDIGYACLSCGVCVLLGERASLSSAKGHGCGCKRGERLCAHML